MKNQTRKIVAEEAARLIVDGLETEYLHAKERAIMMLGLPEHSSMPTNRQIKECIALISRERLGDEELNRRLFEMRSIAKEIMECIDDADPFLIGSTLAGDIRESSDIDLHAYGDDSEYLKEQLLRYGFEGIEEELVENRKGKFVHLRFCKDGYPVEITVYPWAQRDLTPISSVTGKAMKRADFNSLRKLLKSCSY